MFFNEEEILNEEVVTEEVVETVEDSTPEVAPEESKPAAKNAPHTSAPIAEEFLPDNFNPFARPVNPRFADRGEQEFEERVLQVKRVIKVTKGGRRFKFSALVVVGDKKGRVGYAIGKHIEVPEAIKKAVRQAKKNLVKVKIVGAADTIPHEAIGHKGAARVMLKPAAEGKGVIASDVVRAVVELAGYRNIYSKNLGTNNPNNVVIGTINALVQMRTATEIADLKKELPKRPTRENTEAKKEVAK
jgi:small subunit ribosomal protein S5